MCAARLLNQERRHRHHGGHPFPPPPPPRAGGHRANLHRTCMRRRDAGGCCDCLRHFPRPGRPRRLWTSCERAADALASEVTAGRCTNLPSSTERQLVALSATCASAGGPAAAAACATCAELGWPVTIRGLNYNRQVCATSAVLAVAGMTDATTPPVTPPANSPPAPCQSGVGYRAAEATCASHWRDCHCHATVTVLPTVTLLSCYCHLLSSTAAIVIMVNPYQPFLPAVTISK